MSQAAAAVTAPQLEIAVTSPAAASAAITHGADRIELCVALETGGVTPSQALVEATLATGAETHVLVRCRPGDFVYDHDEVTLMAKEAATLARAGVDGVVIGALTDTGTLDLHAIQAVADAARAVNPDLAVTIHRCVDAASDPVMAAATLAAATDLAPTRVLTSGGHPSAGEAIGTIAAMVAATRTSAAPGLQVMAGGGVTLAAIGALLDTGICAVHLSAKRAVRQHYRLDPRLVAAARTEIQAHPTGGADRFHAAAGAAAADDGRARP